MHEFNLSDPDQRNQCAAEYVLGTLDKHTKSRFEALLAVSHDLQTEVEQWREYLDILNLELRPVMPPKKTWSKINAATKPKSTFAVGSLQLLSLLSVMFVMILGLYVIQTERTQDVYVHLINNKQEQPGWIVNTALDQNKIIVQALNPVTLPKNQRYELWLIEAGHEPMTLGFLPEEGTRYITVPLSWKSRLLNCEIIVTLEGPTGAPNSHTRGPVSDRAHWQPI